MNSERPAALSGSFYPKDPESLSCLVGTLLQDSERSVPLPFHPDFIRALIVPHGEYRRSGPVAASAYRALAGRSTPPEKVVIAAPLHYFPESGVILPTAGAYRVPTGLLPVDRKTIRKLAFCSETVFSEEAHAYEHSIETQLPFIQEIWGNIPIVPIGFSDISTDVLAHIFDSFLSDPATLLLVTSDFSDYFSYDQAKKIDTVTFERILKGQPVEILHSCGALGINALLKVVSKRQFSIELLDARNSGDITGEKGQVTGYATFALFDNPSPRA
jgi:hypothetical protein